MTDRLPLDLPPAIVELKLTNNSSATVRLTRLNREFLAAGIHPATRRPLTGDGRTCGDCPHALVTYHDPRRRWWKCELHRLGPSADFAWRLVSEHVPEWWRQRDARSAARRVRSLNALGRVHERCRR